MKNFKEIKDIVVMKSSIMFLRACYIFPSKEEISRGKINISIKFTALYVIIGCYFPISVALHLVKNIKYDKHKYIGEDIMKLLSFCGASYFTFRYLKSINNIVSVCRRLSDFKTFGKPTNFDSKNEWLSRASVCYFLYHITIISLIASSNAKRGIEQISGKACRLWLYYIYDCFPLKQIIFIYEFLVAVLVYHNAGIISYAMFESVEHLNIRFDHLSEKLVEILEIEDSTRRRKQFCKAVKYHNCLLKLGDMINNCYGPCCIVHMILTAPVLGTTGYTLATAASVGAICLFIGWIISTVLVCTGGQRLQNSSEILGDILYQTKWYIFEKELQREILLMILRAQRPVHLSASPFGNMNNEMMVAIAKASYSYLIFLNHIL